MFKNKQDTNNAARLLFVSFCPRSSIKGSCTLATISPCVCLSVTVGVLWKLMKELSLFWARELSFILSYTVLKRNSPKIRVLPSGTLFQSSDLENVASAYRLSKRVIDLARRSGRSERDKLDRRRSTKLIIPPISDARPL